MSMTQASSEYFQRVAGSWDQISAGYFGKAVRDTAIGKAYLRPETVVADVGAGTGFVAPDWLPWSSVFMWWMDRQLCWKLPKRILASSTT